MFVDTQVSNYQQLIDDLIAQNTEGSRNFEIILVNENDDGLDLISKTLENQESIDSIHIISHGVAGEITLGNTQLSFDTLLSNASDIGSRSNVLDTEADLLIYGCDLASTQDGTCTFCQSPMRIKE